jgi:hypothetical protein
VGTFSFSVCDEAASVVTVRFARGCNAHRLVICTARVGLRALLSMTTMVVGGMEEIIVCDFVVQDDDA